MVKGWFLVLRQVCQDESTLKWNFPLNHWWQFSLFVILEGLGRGDSSRSVLVTNSKTTHHAAQNGMWLKFYELLISGIFHLISPDCSWPRITETTKENVGGAATVVSRPQSCITFLHVSRAIWRPTIKWISHNTNLLMCWGILLFSRLLLST